MLTEYNKLISERMKTGINSSHQDYHEASKKITDLAIRGASLSDFITESLKIISTFIKSKKIDIEFEEEDIIYKCKGQWFRSKTFNLEITQVPSNTNAKWDVEDYSPGKESEEMTEPLILPLVLGKDRFGKLRIERHGKKFSLRKIDSLNVLVQSFVLALAYRRTHIALRERVKEQSCLYQLARISSMPDIALPEIFQRTVELLPPAWLYPEIASARISFDQLVYRIGNFNDKSAKISADIVIADKKRGCVEVFYTKPKPDLYEGPFLKEERNLINAIARELSFVIQRKEVVDEKRQLKEQMLHADRLATIGQLAAGVAHELNEPLANILGFAQLVAKSEKLSDQNNSDVEKIVNASIHAREVIKKLLVFSRQTIPEKIKIDINNMIKEALYFFESRCARMGIDLKFLPAPRVNGIYADPSQLNQVIINLVVNAIQATPEGGKLVIKTYDDEKGTGFKIEDTGIGIKPENIGKIFMPFFTTKDVNEGTGLGLAVVHGIVTAHGGTVKVESQQGFGSIFDVHFPSKSNKENEGNKLDGQ